MKRIEMPGSPAAGIGTLTGSKILLSGSMALDSAEYSKAGMFVLTIILGLIYGFLVELVAWVLFNARLVRTTPVSAARV